MEWLKIKWMRFEKGSLEMKYKFSHNENEEWMICGMCHNKRRKDDSIQLVMNFQPQSAYESSRQISAEKYRDLMKLLDYVPPIYHNFYKNLPHGDLERPQHIAEHPDILDSDTERALETQCSELNSE